MALDCFAQCTPGLEPILAAELSALGVRQPRPDRGGVAFRATTRQLYAANVWLRTANRVLLRVGTFPARTWDALEAGAAAIDWARYLPPGGAPRFRVSASRSRLYHTGAIAERLERVVGGGAPAGVRVPVGDRGSGARGPGARGPEAGVLGPGAPGPGARGPAAPPAGEAAPLVVARVVRDRATLSVDTSGEALHRRGWRQQTAKAPLRETLAAAIVLASGWDRVSPLVDPFCGSGTILVEAALLARDLAPGAERRFAFHGWPCFEAGTWASVRGELAARARPLPAGAVLAGSDRDTGAVQAALANAARAGVEGDLTVRQASVSALEAPGGAGRGWLATNPPYGGRASAGRDLRDLYARLGDVARHRLPGWHVALLVADTRLAAHARLGLQESLRTTNGGIDVRLLVGDVPAASGS